MTLAQTNTKGKTLAEFRSQFDPDVRVPELIRAGLKSLLAEGQEAWEYEQEFIARCGQGVSNANIGKYRPQFEKHIVVTRGKNPKNIWFADPKVAAKVKV